VCVGVEMKNVSYDTLRRFEFIVYVLMIIHLWRRDTAIILSVSKFNKLND